MVSELIERDVGGAAGGAARPGRTAPATPAAINTANDVAAHTATTVANHPYAADGCPATTAATANAATASAFTE